MKKQIEEKLWKKMDESIEVDDLDSATVLAAILAQLQVVKDD